MSSLGRRRLQRARVHQVQNLSELASTLPCVAKEGGRRYTQVRHVRSLPNPRVRVDLRKSPAGLSIELLMPPWLA